MLEHFYSMTIKESLSSILIYSDYYFATLILTLFLAKTHPSEDVAATGYMLGYYSVSLFALNIGVVQNVAIYAAQAFGVKDFHKMNQLLRQGIVAVMILIIFVLIPGGIFSHLLLQALWVPENVALLGRASILWMLPGLTMRSITEMFKSFLQAQKIISEIGYANMFTFVIFLIYSSIIMLWLKMGHPGFGICIFLMELSNMLVCLYLYLRKAIPESRSTIVSWTENFLWFSWEALKTTATYWMVTAISEVIVIILTKYSTTDHVSAFTITFGFANVHFFIAESLSVYPRTIVNMCIGKREMKGAKSIYNMHLKFHLIVSLINIAILGGVKYINYQFFTLDNRIAIIEMDTFLLMLIIDLLMYLLSFNRMYMNIIELKLVMMAALLISGIFTRGGLILLFVGYFSLGLTGVIYGSAIGMIGVLIVGFPTVSLYDWNKIKGLR